MITWHVSRGSTNNPERRGPTSPVAANESSVTTRWRLAASSMKLPHHESARGSPGIRSPSCSWRDWPWTSPSRDKASARDYLKDALLRTLQAADIGGLRAVIVHAKDAQAKAFYEKFGFEASPLDQSHLMLLLKDVRKTVMGSD